MVQICVCKVYILLLLYCIIFAVYYSAAIELHGVYTVDIGLSYLAATCGVNRLVLCIRLDQRPVPRGPSVTKWRV